MVTKEQSLPCTETFSLQLMLEVTSATPFFSFICTSFLPVPADPGLDSLHFIPGSLQWQLSVRCSGI